MPLKTTVESTGTWSPDPESGTLMYAERLSDPRWRAVYVFAPVKGQIALVEVSVMPTAIWEGDTETYEDSLEGGITTRLLREVKAGRTVELVHRALNIPGTDPFVSEETKASWREHILPPGWDNLVGEPPSRPGRAGRDDSYYLFWAVRYIEKIQTGSPQPIAELAADHDLKPSQVRDLIHKARERELLSRGVQGKSGGALTEKARLLLSQREREGGNE